MTKTRRPLRRCDAEDAARGYDAVTAAMGYKVDLERIAEAVQWHESTPIKDLRAELETLEALLSRTGGRGVELADEIDTIRIAIAAREPLG